LDEGVSNSGWRLEDKESQPLKPAKWENGSGNAK
jgi:hypothetical protein